MLHSIARSLAFFPSWVIAQMCLLYSCCVQIADGLVISKQVWGSTRFFVLKGNVNNNDDETLTGLYVYVRGVATASDLQTIRYR